MTVESATYINQLDTSLPPATDLISEGDDHIRLLKSTVRSSFPNVTGAVTASHTELSYTQGVSAPLQGQFSSKSTRTGDTYSGSHDFMAGTVQVATPTAGDNSNKAASTAYVVAAGLTASLPGQAGNAGKYIKTDGTNASWAAVPTGISLSDANTWTQPQTFTNPTASSSTDPVNQAMVQGNGGSGDGNLASLALHCPGTYATKLNLRADGVIGFGGWSRAAWTWYQDASGNSFSSGNVTAYSDPRLKENFARVVKPLSMLAKLDGGTFTWREGIAHTACKAGKRDYGVLADQVESVMPEIVTESIEIDGDKYLTVDYSKLVPVLIEAVKELHARIEALERV